MWTTILTWIKCKFQITQSFLISSIIGLLTNPNSKFNNLKARKTFYLKWKAILKKMLIHLLILKITLKASKTWFSHKHQKIKINYSSKLWMSKIKLTGQSSKLYLFCNKILLGTWGGHLLLQIQNWKTIRFSKSEYNLLIPTSIRTIWTSKS